MLKNFFKGDKVIWIIFLLFCMVSIIEVFSASSTLTFRSGDHWAPITNHFSLLFGGAVFVWIVHIIPCRFFWTGVALLPISWALLVIVLVMSVAVNGANRWIDLGFIQFQPSELAKMALIIVVAKILAIFQGKDGVADGEALKWIGIVTLPTVALIGVENLSTAAILIVTVFLMMFIGHVPRRQMFALTSLGVGGIILALFLAVAVPNSVWNSVGLHRIETWKARIERFGGEKVPPAKYNVSDNQQVAHANIAIATSHLWGKGPGNSVERDSLPQAFSDFIYAIVIEELGLIGGAFVAFLYIFLMMRAGKIARWCNNPFYSYLVTGICILIATQAMFNMMVAVGIMPVTGQPLPLISKGGSSTLINCAFIGIILSISHYVYEKRRQEEAEQQPAEAPQLPNPDRKETAPRV